MKIQLAIDRVPLAKAIELSVLLRDYVDVIEVGTSLIKDYGMLAVREIKTIAGSALVLADMKVIDEGQYEFEAAFAAGADYVTLMGAAAWPTLRICEETAKKHGKDYVIDLMETHHEKCMQIAKETTGILCFHMPADESGGLQGLIENYSSHYKNRRASIAGGVTVHSIPLIRASGFETAIVGGAITKNKNPLEVAKQIRELLK